MCGSYGTSRRGKGYWSVSAGETTRRGSNHDTGMQVTWDERLY